MGQASTKRIQNHISALEGAGYTVNEKLATKLRDSLTSLNAMNSDEEQLMCLLPVLNEVMDTGGRCKRETNQQSLPKPKFFLNCYNGSHIVLPLLLHLDWNRVTDRREIGQCCFRWTETVMQLNFQVFKECEQMVNHIPNCGLFTNKLGLLMSLRSYADDRRSDSRKDSIVNFIPETYWIDDIKEKIQFVNKLNDNQTWIMKPCGLNQGKGICLIRSQQDFTKLEETRFEEFRRNPQMCRPRIVQKYLTSPLLLNKRKFDIRCYLMIASTMPYLVLFTPGYIRLSLRKYDLADTNLVTHLTNQFIQKRDPSYDKSKDDSVWTFKKLNDYINTYVAPNKHLPRNWVTRHMLPEMHRITTHVFNAVKHRLACRIGFFEIYGVDFMVDDGMKVWLIEINSNPAMNTNCEVLRQVIPPIVTRFIHISIECFEKARRWQPLLPILGILPRTSSEIGNERDPSGWNVSLRSPPKCVVNGGLPASFTILFNEGLTEAKSRQNRCYNIPLQLWVPPKMYVTVHLPKPGLVIRQATSPPSHTATPSRTAELIHKPSASASLTPKSSPPGIGSPKATPYGLRERSFFRSSSSLQKATNQSESSCNSADKDQIPTTDPQKPQQKPQETVALVMQQKMTFNETDVSHATLLTHTTTSHDEVHKLTEPQKDPEESNDINPPWPSDNTSDENVRYHQNPQNQEVTGEQNRNSNESNTTFKVFRDCALEWARPSLSERVSVIGFETTAKNHLASNNNSSMSTNSTLRSRKSSKDRNNSCSVKIPPLVADYMVVPGSSTTMPPLPPLVLAATLLTEIPNEEEEGTTTNNANESVYLLEMR